MQRRNKEPGKSANPSFVGDSGFWAQETKFQEYITANVEEDPNEKASIVHCSYLLYSLYCV